MGRFLVAVVVFSVAAAGSTTATGVVTQDVDVSNAPDAQAEVSIAADPSEPNVLVAGSMSLPTPALRSYTSTNGGITWTTVQQPVPPPQPGCGTRRWGADPVVAIDSHGREYFAFVTGACTNLQNFAYVATRPGPSAGWSSPDAPAVATIPGRIQSHRR